MARNLFRRTFRIVGAATVVLTLILLGIPLGVLLADHIWVEHLNHLGATIHRLDQDLAAGGGPTTREGNYYLHRSDLPLERFDSQSVTYYIGSAGAYSVTIQFDDSGVTGMSVR